MDFDRSSHQSDFSQASVVSIGPSVHSIQTTADEGGGGDDGETAPLLVVNDVTIRSEQRQGTSWYMSIFLVVNAALGAGILNFPAAYHESGGLVVGIVAQLVLGVFIIGSMLILIYCAQIHSSATYQDVVFTLCGKRARLLCSIFVALYSFGTCVTFMIIIGDQWDKFLQFVYPRYEETWFLSRKFMTIITCVVFILPLCFPKRIDFLKYPSAVGVLAVLYCVVLVAVKYFTTADTAAEKGPVRTRPEYWTDVFTIVPVVCFGYQCHLSLVPIYACTKKRTLNDFSKTIFVALFLCFLTYTITASLGYLTFGSNIQQDILVSYNPMTADVLVAVIGIALKMYTTYPILLFVGRAALDSVWMDMRSYTSAEMLRGERMRRIVIALIWFVISLLLAVFVPNIGIVIKLLGALAAIFIFSFPGICLLQLLLQGYLEMNCIVKHYGWSS
jgi:solute carrier family 38 (sodium-coupled neutral amino acid transporter), member 7/8